MERTALQKLVDWNSNKRKKPLIVWGAAGWKNLSDTGAFRKKNIIRIDMFM